jgi:hypothetical protein
MLREKVAAELRGIRPNSNKKTSYQCDIIFLYNSSFRIELYQFKYKINLSHWSFMN